MIFELIYFVDWFAFSFLLWLMGGGGHHFPPPLRDHRELGWGESGDDGDDGGARSDQSYLFFSLGL